MLLDAQVEEMNSFLAELVNIAAKEQLSLVQCKDFLSTLTAMQVKIADICCFPSKYHYFNILISIFVPPGEGL